MCAPLNQPDHFKLVATAMFQLVCMYKRVLLVGYISLMQPVKSYMYSTVATLYMYSTYIVWSDGLASGMCGLIVLDVLFRRNLPPPQEEKDTKQVG